MAERQVKVTLIIDEKGAVRAMRSAADESSRTEGHFKKLDKEVKGLGKSFHGLKNMIGYGLGALGAGGLVFGLQDIASKTKEIALETEQFHTQTGIGATQSLYYSKALKARGLSTEQVGKAFGILSKNVRSAELQEHSFAVTQEKAAVKGRISTGILGRQATAFKELGINLVSFNQLTEAQKLEKVTKAFEALTPGMRKTRLERELFGRGGNQLSIVLEKGNLGLTHQIELVKRYFPTIKGGSHAMQELLEKQTESKMAWEGLEFTLGQKLIPAMTSVMGWFSKTAIEVQRGTGFWGHLGKGVSGVVDAVKDVVHWLKRLADTFNIKIGAGGLGAALMAFAGIHVAKKVPGVKTGAKAAGKLVKGVKEHPELAPFVAGAALPYASAFGIHSGVEALSPGYLREHSLAEVERAISGRVPHGVAGRGKETAGGRPAGGGITPGEGAILAKAIESLKPTSDEHHFTMIMDGEKVAEGLLKNPRARRKLAESMAIYAQQMTARK